MKIDIQEEYLKSFESFVNSLPKDAIKITSQKKSLNEELEKRIEEYYSGNMDVIPHDEMWDLISIDFNEKT